MPFKKGQSGGPSGRSADGRLRNMLSERLLSRLRADFDKHGIEAIQEARERDPIGYLRIIASLVPPEMNLTFEHSFGDVLRQAAREMRLPERKQGDALVSVIEGEANKVEDGG